MFSKKGTSFFQTTTFRLTLWYLGVFSALSTAVFLVVYGSLAFRLRHQVDQEILDKSKEFEALYREQGVRALQAEFNREAQSQGTRRVFFQLLTPQGKWLAASDMRQWKDLRFSRRTGLAGASHLPAYRTVDLPTHRHKFRLISMATGDGNVIRIGSSLQGEDIILEKYRETFGTALVVMLACGGLFGFLLARKAMSGVERITETATRIGGRDLSRRVPPTHQGQEIDALAEAFNAMLERIESLMKELRQITDNVAHELRTPLTRIRGIAETTLKGGANLDDYREMAGSVIEGCDDLIEMIAMMLEIARTDSGVAALDIEPLDMREIVLEAADLFAPMAEDKRIAIRWVDPSQAAPVAGDRPRLQRVVANLLDNAIKYTPGGGTVTLSMHTDKAGVELAVTDTGQGIDAKDLPHVFDRFYRGDQSRSTAGSGLGLSLARAIIRAHGGDLTVKSTAMETAFSLFLPNAPPP